jgi:hypothetical protein
MELSSNVDGGVTDSVVAVVGLFRRNALSSVISCFPILYWVGTLCLRKVNISFFDVISGHIWVVPCKP